MNLKKTNQISQIFLQNEEKEYLNPFFSYYFKLKYEIYN